MNSPMTTHQMIDARGILPPALTPWQKGHIVKHAKAKAADAKLTELVGQNAGKREIADIMGCSIKAVEMRAYKLRLSVPRPPNCRPYNGNVAAAPRPPSSITPNAMKAQAAMFRLLDSHFDPDAGSYESGWDDARVAKESGIACGMVSEFRKQGFGELKCSPELQAITADIKALKTMIADLEARMPKAGVRS